MKQFGLIGYPLGHSFSKKYFTEKFAAENIDAAYELYPLENIELFADLIKNHELTGLNVTIPYKEKVMPFLQELDDTAKEIGAVNVIKFIRKDDKTILKGYNSDTIGFSRSIRPMLKSQHSKALILGTGGASKAVEYSLRKLGLETTYVSRKASPGILAYEDLSHAVIQDYKVIVNCTPLGMEPANDTFPDIPYEAVTSEHLLYDIVYKPAETVFMQKGKAQGAIVVNGLEMLYGQAEAAWKIWNES